MFSLSICLLTTTTTTTIIIIITVCDPSRRLSDNARYDIAVLVDAIKEGIQDPKCGPGKGYEVAVVISDHTQTQAFPDAESCVEGAKNLMDAWHIGEKGCNNGVVLLLAIDDRKFAIYAGKGAQDHLPDSIRTRILNNMKGDLRENRLDRAVTNAVIQIRDALMTMPTFWDRYGDLIVFFVFVGIVFMFFCCIAYSSWREERRRKRRVAEVRKLLRQIDNTKDDEKAVAKAKRFGAKTCPICLEAFDTMPNRDEALLQCGHKLCVPCSTQWFGESNLTKTKRVTYALSQKPHYRCPVCRASCMFKNDSSIRDETTPLIPPVSTTNTTTNRTSSSSSTTTTTSDSQYCHVTSSSFHHDLRRHRYMSVRRRYRDLVTPSQIDTWMLATSQQGNSNFRAEREWHTAYERAERLRRIANNSSTSSRSSSSFGGGSSFGGSGSGGGW
jgi:uncharacterized membrane protein YgcG